MADSNEAKAKEELRVMKEVHRRVVANQAAGMTVNGVPPELGSAQYQAWLEATERTRQAVLTEEAKRREGGLNAVRADLARRAAIILPLGMGMGAAGRK